MRSGNNSKRPANMSKIMTNFEKSLKCPKLAVGPTISKPGPMLLSVAATAVNKVIKSLFSKVNFLYHFICLNK